MHERCADMTGSHDRAIRLLKAILPGLDELFQDYSANGGWPTFDPQFVDLVVASGLAWWVFYEDHTKLRSLTALAFLNDEQVRAISDREAADAYTDKLAEILESFSDDVAHRGENAFVAKMNEGPAAEKEVHKRMAALIMGTLAALFNYLALMVHGKSLCRLVNDAKSGDDKAFCLAVQTDRTVLNLPYFRQRMIRAQLRNDSAFLKKVGYRIKNPPIVSKTKHPRLWLAFAILEDEGLLDLPHDELLDICEEVGVYGRVHGVEEVGHFRKRLREYRKAQGTSKIF